MAGTFNTGLSEAQISNAFSRALGDYTDAQIDTKLAQKQDTITDLAAIRSGAEAGATAVQPAALAAETSAREAADSEMQTEIEQKVTLEDVFGTGKLIPDYADIDTYTIPGKYYGGNSAGNTVSHLPVENGSFTFTLDVRQATPSMTYHYLRICRLADDPYIYIRRKYTTWGSWYRFTGEAVASSTQSTAALMSTMPGKSAEITAEDEPEEEMR